MLDNRLLSQVSKVRKMSPNQILMWAQEIYKQGFIDGLREGETEFDDAIILTEEEAKKHFDSERVDKLLGEADDN